MEKDIKTREDIDELIADFYSVVIYDPMIGHHFDGLDLRSHLPIIADFWEKALFAQPVYFGNPLIVHQLLHDKHPLTPEHFAQWVAIFIASIDKLFAGDVAEKAKYQARMVADSLNQRLNQDLRFAGLNSRVRPY